MKIALTMISKGHGEEQKLDRALSSIVQSVDKIFLTFTSPTNLCTEAEKIANKYGAVVSYKEFLHEITSEEVDWLTTFLGHAPYMKVGEKIFLFDEARNYNLSQVPPEYEWFIWMDTDDYFTFRKDGMTLHQLAEACDKQSVECVYFNYLYQCEFNEKGQITAKIIEHFRERLLKNNGHYKWIAPIHETCIEQLPTKKTDHGDVQIVHLATPNDRVHSLERNLNNLEYAIYQSKGEDPRHVYYYAKALFDKNTDQDNEDAIHLILRYLNGDENGNHQSGWPEERMQAWEYLAEIYRRKGQHNNALKAALNGLTEPCEPSIEILLSVALGHLLKGNNENALYWTKQAINQTEKKTSLVKNPKDIQMRTLQIIFNASLNLSKVDEVWAVAVKMYELSPNEPEVINALRFAQELKDERDMTMNVTKIARYLEQHGEAHKLKSLLQATPLIAERNPFIAEIANKVLPPRVHGEKEIAIYCGQGWTQWSPRSDLTNTFIGGSEEAVLKLSHELHNLGYSVTVYNDPEIEGEYDGVKYVPYYKFNTRDEFNILIGWRQFPPDVKAKQKYYWAHDVLNQLDFTKERLDKLDKVIVLSEFHRKVIQNVPDEKVLISSNAI